MVSALLLKHLLKHLLKPPPPASVKLSNGDEIKGCKAEAQGPPNWNVRNTAGEQFGHKATQCNDKTDRFVYSTSNLFGKTTKIYNHKKGEVTTYTKNAWQFLTDQKPDKSTVKVTTTFDKKAGWHNLN